jgi:uncharacterized protein YndB with AHSA1/START domain
MPRDILHVVDIHADPATVFEALATHRGQTAFWTTDATASEPTVGSLASFGFPGTAERIKMRIQRLEAGRIVEWACEGDYPGWAGTRLTWELRPTPNAGETSLLFRHAGYGNQNSEEQYARVNWVWGQIVGRLKGYSETGQPQPFFAAQTV